MLNYPNCNLLYFLLFLALGEAMTIARSISRFPQECMKRDRISAYHATFGANSLQEALMFEHNNAVHVIKQEAVQGRDISQFSITYNEHICT